MVPKLKSKFYQIWNRLFFHFCLYRTGVTIGNNVNIGGDCLIMDSDSHPHDYIQRRRDFAQKCRIVAKDIPADVPAKIVNVLQ